MIHTVTEEKFFRYAMVWRIGYGILRILIGLAMLKVIGTPLTDLVSSIMGHELGEDPNDIFYRAMHSALATHHLSVSYFLATYFLFWGTLDVFLSYNILKHRIWAFPSSIVLMGGFIAYELVRFSHNHSLILLGVIVIDALVLILIAREYQFMLSSIRTKSEPPA